MRKPKPKIWRRVSNRELKSRSKQCEFVRPLVHFYWVKRELIDDTNLPLSQT